MSIHQNKHAFFFLPVEKREIIVKYDYLGRHYFENALNFVKMKEYTKAGEMLWGSVTEYFKIIALITPPHRPLPSSHGEARRYVRQICEALNDRELFKSYKSAEKLHANFYQDFLDEEDFVEYYIIARRLIEKLFKMTRGMSEK